MKAIVTATTLALSVTAAAAEEKDKALLAYALCLSETAEKLDDGRTDPKIIALGVAADCQWKRELAIAELTETTTDPGALQSAAEGIRSSEQGIIVSAVLSLRKIRSGRK